MTTVLAFRCDALRSKLSIASCAANYAAANGLSKAGGNDAMRKGLYPRQAGLAPCVGCALGAEHAETGKARAGLHLTVIGNAASSATSAPAAPAPTPAPVAAAKPFEDTKPSGIVDAARPNAHAAIAAELREIVKERINAGATRTTPWPERAIHLAVELCERYGVKKRELEAIGLNYFTVRGWVRKVAAEGAGDALNRAVAEPPPAATTTPPARKPKPSPEPAKEEPAMPIDDEPELPPAAENLAEHEPVLEKVVETESCIVVVEEDEIVDFCERIGLGFRLTQAVIAIGMGRPIEAFRILGRVIDRNEVA